MNRLLVLLLIVAAPAARAEATQCTHGDITRSVEVVYASPPGQLPCEVVYSKPTEGNTRTTLWSAHAEPGFCEARAKEFVQKLEGLGWNCGGAPAGDEPADATPAKP